MYVGEIQHQQKCVRVFFASSASSASRSSWEAWEAKKPKRILADVEQLDMPVLPNPCFPPLVAVKVLTVFVSGVAIFSSINYGILSP